MARMASIVNVEFDAAAAITLRNGADAVETADAAETGVALDLLTDAYWDNDEQSFEYLLVSVDFNKFTRTDSDEIVDLYIEVDTVSGFGSAVEVARIKGIVATGFYKLVVPRENVEKLKAGAKFIRIRADITDADTDATYGYAAWLTLLSK